MQATLRDEVAKRQAKQSRNENEIEPLRFWMPLKGVRGYHEGEAFTVEAVAEWFTEKDYPLYAQKKFDGARCEIMKQGDRVVIRSEDGPDVLRRYPSIVDFMKKLNVDAISLDVELEMWDGTTHYGREVVSGYQHSNTKPDDSKIVINVHDCLYYNKDLHNEPYSERYKIYNSLPIDQSTSGVPKPGFNRVPITIVKERKDLDNAIKELSKQPASEGAMIKSAASTYVLTGMTRSWVKFKTMADLHMIVLGKLKTKTSGTYNLEVGLAIPFGWQVPSKIVRELNGKKFAYAGKTFNTKEGNVGDIITVRFHTLFHHKSGNEQYVTVYEPDVYEVGREEKNPDDLETAITIAKEANLYQLKTSMQIRTMDDEKHPYVLHLHARGRTIHFDLRIKFGDHLEGFTMNIEKPNEIKEPIETMEQARAIVKDWSKYIKLEDKPESTKVQIEWKEPEPIEWYNFEGVQPPGEVGATRENAGIFLIVEHGNTYIGAQKPYFHEFFFEGEHLTGKWMIRRIPSPYKQNEFLDLLWKPEDQTPYVLTTRARRLKYIPPYGISGLPPDIRSSIAKPFKYWEEQIESKRISIRDELISKQTIKASSLEPPDITNKKGKFVLQHHWWSRLITPGRKPIIRTGPSREYWDLRIEYDSNESLMHFICDQNIIYNDSDAIYKEDSDHSWLTKEGEINPGSEENPTKDTPSKIEILANGQVKILVANDNFVRMQFNSKELKGLYVALRVPDSNLWTIRPSKTPES